MVDGLGLGFGGSFLVINLGMTAERAVEEPLGEEPSPTPVNRAGLRDSCRRRLLHNELHGGGDCHTGRLAESNDDLHSLKDLKEPKGCRAFWRILFTKGRDVRLFWALSKPGGSEGLARQTRWG